MHANNLRKFYVRVNEVVCHSILLISPELCDDVTVKCNTAIIYDNNADFREVMVIDTPACVNGNLLRSQKLNLRLYFILLCFNGVSYLQVLDKHPHVFSDTPGLCTIIQHEIPIASDFRPKRLKAYRVPEMYKPEVNRKFAELLRLGFIEPSSGPMASPVVYVLKQKDITKDIRIAIDYRYMHRYTLPNATPLSDISEIIQKVGRSRYISIFDAKSGYHQCQMFIDHRWLTAFVCDTGELYQFTRMPFGMCSSGFTFVTAIK